MRVLRTEMYFDDESVQGAAHLYRPLRAGRPLREEQNNGIAFVWFRSGDQGPYEIQNYKWFDGREINVDQVPQALDLLVRDTDQRELFRKIDGQEISNPKIVSFVLEQDIILEESPPSAVSFKNLLKKTNSALLIGAYMGHSISGENPLLMFLTIPGGIIVVGSALGIADAMAHGLNKQIKRLFDRK